LRSLRANIIIAWIEINKTGMLVNTKAVVKNGDDFEKEQG